MPGKSKGIMGATNAKQQEGQHECNQCKQQEGRRIMTATNAKQQDGHRIMGATNAKQQHGQQPMPSRSKGINQCQATARAA